jgi:hypothetical protein
MLAIASATIRCPGSAELHAALTIASACRACLRRAGIGDVAIVLRGADRVIAFSPVKRATARSAAG